MISHLPKALVQTFYDLRTKNDPELLRPMLATNVRWCEPELGKHMGVLEGADAVVDMIRRALVATDGTFRLTVKGTLETATHCAAVIAWSARKGGQLIQGQEMALFGFKGDVIQEAYFFASNIADDEAFWA